VGLRVDEERVVLEVEQTEEVRDQIHSEEKVTPAEVDIADSDANLASEERGCPRVSEVESHPGDAIEAERVLSGSSLGSDGLDGSSSCTRWCIVAAKLELGRHGSGENRSIGARVAHDENLLAALDQS
jgi:hypothetical protein